MSEFNTSDFVPAFIEYPSKPKRGVRVATEEQEYYLGTPYKGKYGDEWVYIKNGAVALAAGQVVQSPVPVGDHINIAVGAAVAVGMKEVAVTTTLSTALSTDQYKGGVFHINDATGEGGWYRIAEHTASVTPVITLEEALVVALASTSEFTLTPNAYLDVIVKPATPTAQPLGVPAIAIPANYYGWILVKGQGSGLVDTGDTIVPGNTIGSPATAADAGSIGVPDSTAPLGWALTANAATEYAGISVRF